MIDIEHLEREMADLVVGDSRFYGPRTISSSIIGDPCEMKVALKLRSFPQKDITARRALAFDIGHLVEKDTLYNIEVIISAAGGEIQKTDPATKKQFQYTSYEGHVKTKIDGLIFFGSEAPEIIEVKSANKADFNRICKHGIEKAVSKYFDQVQLSMGLSGLTTTLFAVVCKDDGRTYFERVEFDAFRWAFLQTKIEKILSGEEERIADSEKAWPCQMCEVAEACWHGKEPSRTLRHCHHCEHSMPDIGQTWWCSAIKNRIPLSILARSCPLFSTYKPKPKS